MINFLKCDNFYAEKIKHRRSGRVDECIRLEIENTAKRYRGFKSLLLRQDYLNIGIPFFWERGGEKLDKQIKQM